MKKISCVALFFLLLACNDPKPVDPGIVNSPGAPKALGYSLVNSFPHDTSSYTEGLLIYKGELYEGTGDPSYSGHSRLIRSDLSTGKSIRSVSLPAKYFGEGIIILRDTVYQWTYQEHTLLMYALKDLKAIKEIKYTIPAEGWGMTTDGNELIASGGTNELYFFEPGTFRLKRTVAIAEAGAMAFNINELEYIDGFIYANQWQTPYILKIDPATGVIVGKADLSTLVNRVNKKHPAAGFLNGIAYDAATKKIYITGKNWPELYQVAFSN